MAENILTTRILLRYGTYSEWMNSDVILKLGEAAIAAFPNNRSIINSDTTPENTPPAIGIKIGDGIHYFHELPWVQAVAADVFTWAKASAKPTYTASEIQGLRTFIEDIIPGSGGDITIAPRLYQLVQGTGDDANKYFLQYKENTANDWIIDVNHYIDLSDLNKIINWIKTENINTYPNLTTLTAMQTLSFLGTLKTTDTPVENYFVTAVNEENGIINTVKAQPSFANLSGIASVTQGGTGVTSLANNEVLIGSGENAIRTRPIATEIAINTDLVPNYLVKTYVDNAVEGLTGAMHFIGEASVVITANSGVDPRIQGYIFSQAKPGDVILSEAKEYVWTGGAWRLLGDEGSYAIKGSIKDADIAADAGIQQSKIANLSMTFNTKVDKVEGKVLSSNDYTNDDKLKLTSIEVGAQKNIIEHIFLNDVEIVPTTIESLPHSIDLQINEFDQESQNKLNSIETGAQVNTIQHIIFDGAEVLPDKNQTITITSNPHLEHVNKVESLVINGKEYFPNNDKQINLLIDQAALNLNVIEGAVVPNNESTESVNITFDKKLELARIAKTGNIKDLLQNSDEYITLYCGTSTEII